MMSDYDGARKEHCLQYKNPTAQISFGMEYLLD